MSSSSNLQSRIYSSAAGHPRFRRATDVLILVPALIGLVLLIVAYPPSRLETSLAAFIAAVPGWLDPVWQFLYDLLGLWAILLTLAAIVFRRFGVALEALGAFVLAVAIAVVSTRLAVGDWPALRTALDSGASAPVFPSVRVAGAVALIVTVAPQLVRPLQKAGSWVIALGVFSAFLVSNATPGGTIAGLLVAGVTASVVRLAFGTSAGRPEIDSVAASLAQLGVVADGLVVAERQFAGVFAVQGRDAAGDPLLVKVYGRDAYDTQLVAKLWRTLWYQDGGPALRLSRGQAVEHEALVTVLAARAGVPTREVITAGETASSDALLVLRDSAVPLDHAGALDAKLLPRCWSSLALLHAAHIAHLQIDLTSVAMAGDDVALVDFAGATVTPTEDQLQTDRAQLLVVTAVAAGLDDGVRAAAGSLGADGLSALLPYLQTAALRTPLRNAVDAAGIDMDDLRKRVAEEVHADVPELLRLRRLTWWTAIQAVLLVLAAAAVLKAAGNVDWSALRTDLADASWGWIAAGFVVAQLPRVAQGVAMLGAIAANLPFGPVYMKQLATSYLNMAMPSSLARMAVSIRFFQCQGLPAAAAVTAGAIDSLANTAVQGTMLLLLVLFSDASLNLELDTPPQRALRLLWIVIGIVVAAVLTAVLVGRIRRAIVDRIRVWWPQVRTSLGALRASNKLVLLLTGNIATEILFAVALGLFARGLGYPISLSDLLVINISVSLLASFLPIPGGVGVVEFGLTLGLTSAGMPEEPALAAVLLYRIATFYLPPIWGFFAMHWLQRNRYL